MVLSFAWRVILIILFGAVFLAGLCGNSALFIVIMTSKHFRKLLPNLLIAHLTVADFLFCFVSSPYFITGFAFIQPPLQQTANRNVADNLCKSFIMLSYVFGFTRIFLLAIMSLERFVAILHPFFYRTHGISMWSGVRVFAIVGYLWLQAIATTFPAAIIQGWSKYKGDSTSLCEFVWDKSNLAYILPVFAMNFLAPAVIIFYTNLRVFLIARKQNRRCVNVTNNRDSHRKESSSENKTDNIDNIDNVDNNDDDEDGTFKQKGCSAKKHNRRCLNVTNNQDRLGKESSSENKTDNIDNVDYIDNDDDHEDGTFKQKGFSARRHNRRCVDMTNNQDRLGKESSCENKTDNIDNNIDNDDEDGTLKQKWCSARKHTDIPKPTLDNFAAFSKSSNDATAIVALKDLKADSFSSTSKDLSSKKTSKKLNNHSCFRNKSKVDVKYKAKDLTTFFSTLSVVILFFATWLPFVITALLEMLLRRTFPLPVDLFTSILTVTNSAIAPYVIFGTRREIRRSFMDKIFGQNS
eukprot:gene14327-15818_t